MAAMPLQIALSLWHAYRAYILVIIAVALFAGTKFSSQRKQAESQTKGAEQVTQNITVSDNPVQPGNTSLAKSTPLKSETKPGPKRLRGLRPLKGDANATAKVVSAIRPIFFFTSLTGTTEKSARAAFESVKSKLQAAPENAQCKVLDPELHDLSYIDFDDYFVTAPKPPTSEPGLSYLYCIILPSYDIDSIINNFLNHLDETHNDFRIDTSPLSGLTGYSVFGFGDKEGWPTVEEGFCSQAVAVDKWLAKLTGKRRAYPLGFGDVKTDGDHSLQEWCDGLVSVLHDIAENGGGLGEGVPGSGDPIESDEEDAEEDSQRPQNPSRPRRTKARNSQIADLEDIKLNPEDLLDDEPIDFTTYAPTKISSLSSKEMVPSTSPTHAALTKQGYTIVGSHSGVKICRWTKSALRGRGSCYKNSFYGIKSHLCMESTPSLSCSNKCIFCWRHGTNPVGTTWRWKVDPPELIFNGVKEGHYKKIKMLRGVPGVRAERFAEAMRIRHCALSLVGEPIFYPHINELLSLLHNEHISSFLVCNAQHPDELAALQRVTQLYVSIDASNRESLRKIDRPLHRDFWERLQRCLEILREKRNVHRTVYRLTLVKGFNIEDEVEGYADLVEKGLPCFIEIKGVTYCGTSSSSNAGLTMQNVPFYHEIVAFVVALNEKLERRGLSYGLSAEHAHSCCVLLASKRFLVNGKWHTRINYERFFELLEREKQTGESFVPEDYMRETEEWALWGNGGFDPNDQRVHTKGRNKGKIGVPPPSGKVILAGTA
ncbi:S-adenosyl-L-methionine-dependent tRNA 4-demethylwyosine synthase [Trichophyton interdigitale]|nr:S-adenosyl-L-methionine-dependent tRNA 4-demethylwyosine synthase [Trichophyton interdigitale]KAG5216732.1 S-adenosyl-L-methionine-dependent tRNA 4-demethylwyosine synthase [Trichophyton interdigitale]KAG8205274.1 S-adenosyl-L-methionine-dependent tRNA 4-demethylwyosine synthase [Trichophyton interdigitale]